MELKYIVYVTVNLINGKLYFGVHETNPEVFDGYIGNSIYNDNCATQDFPFHKAVRKYGYKNFRRTTIAIFDHTEEGRKAAFKLEEEIVNPTLLRSKNVYNVALGGVGSTNIDQCKKVYQFSLDGNFLRSFKSVGCAGKIINPENPESGKSAIMNVCNNMTYTAYGYYWSYCKEFITKEEYNYERRRRYKPVAQYTLNGKFLRKWKTAREAQEAFNTPNGITKCCIGECKTSCGYIWRWYTSEDNIDPIKNDITLHKYTPIIMTDLLGNDIEYSSIEECLKQNSNLTSKGITSTIKRKHQKTHKGYKFRIKDENIV